MPRRWISWALLTLTVDADYSALHSRNAPQLITSQLHFFPSMSSFGGDQVHAEVTNEAELPPSCPHCFTGHLQSGTPSGEILDRFYGLNEVHDLPCYYARPPPSAPPRSGVILFLHDAFGMTFLNNQLLCDAYAASGFHVYMPDLLSLNTVNGAALSHLLDVEPSKTFLGKVSHCCSFLRAVPHFMPLVRAVRSPLQTTLCFKAFDAVQAHASDGNYRAGKSDANGATDSPTKTLTPVGCVGFCFGGKYSVLLGGGEFPKAACCAGVHPSRVSLPDDLRSLRVPSLFCLAESDFAFPNGKAVDTIEALKREGKTIDYVTYGETTHGFACRGPDSTRAQRTKCQRDVVEFFKLHLPVVADTPLKQL